MHIFNRSLSLLILVTFICLFFTSTSIFAKNSPWVGQAFNGAQCQGKGTGYGPFDYTIRNQLLDKLALVEKHHFSPNVEALIKGESGSLLSDIDYTLRAWPNHHRALNSLSRYNLLFPKKPKLKTPVECYFQRAINFSPKDATTSMLYAIHLHKTKRYKTAQKLYAQAIKLSPNNPVIRYNYGLLLFDLKKYALAQKQAVIAYNENFPLNGLKNKLKRVKHWPPKKLNNVNSNENKITDPVVKQ